MRSEIKPEREVLIHVIKLYAMQFDLRWQSALSVPPVREGPAEAGQYQCPSHVEPWAPGKFMRAAQYFFRATEHEAATQFAEACSLYLQFLQGVVRHGGQAGRDG